MPERASSGAMLHADVMAFMKSSSSFKAGGKCAVGINSSGSMWAAIDATLTIAEPSRGGAVEDLVDVEGAERIGPHDVVGVAHAGAHPRGMDHRGDSPETGCGVQQSDDRLPVGHVAVHHRRGDPEVLQRGVRGIKPVLPDVAKDDGAVSADDLGRGQTHPPAPPVITDT